MEIQLRESTQLYRTKETELNERRKDSRKLKTAYRREYASFVAQFDVSSSPKEEFLAERNLKIGSLLKEIDYLSRMIERANEVKRVSDEKAALQSKINETDERLKKLTQDEQSETADGPEPSWKRC